ncbi:MAG: CAP domain-containing protein [Actinomycetales bacterium]
MYRFVLGSLPRVPRRGGLIILAVLLAATGLPVTSASTASAATSSSGLAAQFVHIINAERAGVGLRPLAVDATMTSVAGGWSCLMATSSRLAHNPRLARSVRSWRYLGENVGVGYSVSSLAAAFWSSPGHRANILDRHYDRVGVAVVNVSGKLWVTEDFLGTGKVTRGVSRVALRPVAHRTGTARPARSAKSPRMVVPSVTACRHHALARFGVRHERYGGVRWPTALSACGRS